VLIVVSLLYYLVRPQQQPLRDRQPERLGGLEVDDQFELRRLLDGQVGGLGAFENLVDVDRAARRYMAASNGPPT
jgi:hypothetical protein